MKFPIYLHETQSGGFSGFVPDIDGVIFAGEDIDNAITDAYAAIDLHLEYQAEKGKKLPVAQDVKVHLTDGDCQGGYWAFVDIDLSKYDGKTVKLNITLPQNLLARIDHHVELNKGSRSGFIAELARRELQKQTA
ncbi:hypothetical protein F164LOC_20755 [Pectobacterium carotovorum]|uniref:type II toxin-antitoxin system HicB family antitoxin n=1 Tax=Pectobacterium versatile TaxID=2488639 RepID=UPI000C7F3169|nr:type II toxin-antitoxin system HicB family antitoxin [Pectobacterium versatile]PLY35370.1 hypothetical protein F164LOC_20755 [Pectobacterium carotovorum]